MRLITENLRVVGKANITKATAVGDGTLSAPGLAFNSDTNTGIYRIGADNLGVVVGGAKQLDVAYSKTTYVGEMVSSTALTQTKSANYTMAEGDSGVVTYVDTDAVVLTLPATAAGLTFTFVNKGAAGAVGFSLSPDANDKIMGAGLTSADNKDLTNTKATAKPGDSVTLVGDGSAGWYVTKMTGTWAREG